MSASQSVVTILSTTSSGSGQTPDLDRFRQYYQCGSLVLENGISDQMLAHLYDRFDREKLLPRLFYEQMVGIYDAIGLYRRPETNAMGCYRENPETLKWEPAGILWNNGITLMGPRHSRANSGMAFFRKTPAESVLRFGQMGLEWAFDRLRVDAVTGVTPAKNRAAVAFARHLGLTVVGPLPGGTVWDGELCDVYMSAITKDQWAAISPWKEN